MGWVVGGPNGLPPQPEVLLFFFFLLFFFVEEKREGKDQEFWGFIFCNIFIDSNMTIAQVQQSLFLKISVSHLI